MANTTTGAREQSREVASTAADEAKDVGRSAQQAAQTVAQDVREQVGEVSTEVRQQVRDLVDETRTRLRDKADSETTGVADSLRSLADQLRALAEGNPDQAGSARRYVEQAGSTVADVADQLRNRSFQDLVQDVQQFARRRPGAFLAATAAAGFVVGRIVRSAKDDAETTSATGEVAGQRNGIEPPTVPQPLPPVTSGSDPMASIDPAGSTVDPAGGRP